MTEKQAIQIAQLLNERNQLVSKWTHQKVLSSKDDFVFLTDEEIVIACAQLKKVQWYQWEICHVSVQADFEGKHLGSQILKMAEQRAINAEAKILQCTIRSNNMKSQYLFLSKGYIKTSSFFYPLSKNWVNVYQKSVSVIEI